MRIPTRSAALTAVLVATAALAGCGDNQQSNAPAPSTTETSESAAPSASAAPDNGLTRTSDIFGPACGTLPKSGAGSAASMVSEPAGTAAGHNPQLSTAVKALQTAGLTDALNDRTKNYTIFAPSNDAFSQLPPGTLDQLLKDKAKLKQVLTYHVIPQRYSAVQLANADTVTSLQGATLAMQGDAQSLTIGDQQAKVLCGNIPTANATVFVIDKVLMPPQS